MSSSLRLQSAFSYQGAVLLASSVAGVGLEGRPVLQMRKERLREGQGVAPSAPEGVVL